MPKQPYVVVGDEPVVTPAGLVKPGDTFVAEDSHEAWVQELVEAAQIRAVLPDPPEAPVEAFTWEDEGGA